MAAPAPSPSIQTVSGWLTKTEINLRRLLAALPQQTNQAKLAQYVVILREQLALLTGESGKGNLPCISEEKAREYAEQIEVAASRVDTNELGIWDTLLSKEGVSNVSKSPRGSLMDSDENSLTTIGLRKRFTSHGHEDRNKPPSMGLDSFSAEQRENWNSGSTQGSTLKVDSATLALIEKHSADLDNTEPVVALGLGEPMKDHRRGKKSPLQQSHLSSTSLPPSDSPAQPKDKPKLQRPKGGDELPFEELPQGWLQET
ncbi:hypothetical protein L7F22_000021 [Adiantum nelumboides]|nr:hypothetical protein [Adiantum nelumboides]